MTFPQLPQAAEQVQDSGQDTTSTVADSIDVSLDRIGQGVTNTGRLILEGEWSAVWEQMLAGVTNLFISSVPSIVSAIFVGAFFYGLYRVLSGVIRGVLRRSRGVDRGLETIVMKTFRVVGWGFIVLLVLSQLGINLSALIAGLGIAGLAVGFAAKDSLENFISGLTILLDRPFKVGDWVTVGNHFGRVSNITLRSTRLETPNRQTVVFPSVHMVTQAVVNHSARGVLRVDVPFGIAYKERIEEAREVVMALLDESDDRLAPDWEHQVVATKLNDSSVDLELRLFIRDAGDQIRVRLDYTEKIRNALREADIEIPFPHLQLFIDGADAPITVRRVEGDEA
ncbi:MAG: mechanosensitive ion channel family protein [Longimicrobiales bacterium]|nr:mechanosensitive ion channel family protein [Longimicrobiales bacterium]